MKNQLPEITELASEVHKLVNPVAYGKLRSKIEKNGFSEIALYKAVGEHCLENDIKITEMAKDMLTLLEGCGKDVFFPKTHNGFHYLRGVYNELRHGNTDKGEMQSAEQRGKFLCIHCHEVKQPTERCGTKQYKFSCKKCRTEKQRLALNKKKVSQAKAIEEATPAKELANNLSTPVITPAEPIQKETIMPRTEAHPLATAPAQEAPVAFSNDAPYTVSEVMADEKEATITIKCPTKSLGFVLARLEGAL